jgi:ATP-binding cassette subfamily B multidrug efflux pump
MDAAGARAVAAAGAAMSRLTRRARGATRAAMFRLFERVLRPTEIPPESPPPPLGDAWALPRFYWHYARQARWLIVCLFAIGLVVATLDTMIPAFIGRVVTLLSTRAPATLLREAWPQLAMMAAVLLVLRPLAFLAQNLVANQAVVPGLTNTVRWQAHWHVVRQSWAFFQNDFAGRIANRVMQSGPALQGSVISAISAVWYIIVYGGNAMVLLGRTDWRLAVPMACWFGGYIALLRVFVPRLRDRSHKLSEVRSNLTGRVVDSYSNILTVKLFARARDEDAFVRDAVDDHTLAYQAQQRTITRFSLTLIAMNATMITATAGAALWLWSDGRIAIGAVAMALPLSHQMGQMAGWVAQNVTQIFENVGVVQDAMRSIAVPRQMPDAPDAGELRVTRGAIRFECVRFGYGTERGVLHDLSLDVAAGERVGLVGVSGAGKSTLVNLLLGFYALESGTILIDGQDISGVSQESLRRQIAVVTQDTSLLHRSIRDNIRYGRPEATEQEIVAAARQAEAIDFIDGLEDWAGRRGFDAHVGERGVKLSGGQRQRIAIARVILKAAPILVLDEATSALDSEVEAAIQSQLAWLMRGRTVIAIAHRLSTIARMDRLVVLDHGRIVEHGSHASLLVQNGAYASLWRRQSGGFMEAAE